MGHSLFAIILLTISLNLSAIPRSFLELTPSERHKLMKGELVMRTKDIEGQAWPEITVYAKIKSTPLDALSVYAAYDHQKNYVPDLLKSKPVKHKSPVDVIVDYESDLPWPLTSTTYTTGNKIGKISDNSYTLDWYLIKADAMKDTKGHANFDRYQDFTIIKYVNHIDPDSFFAPLLKDNMIHGVQVSLKKIISHIEFIRLNRPKKLEAFQEKINSALAGKNVYEK